MSETQELLVAISRGIPANFNFPFGPYVVLLNGLYDSYGDDEYALSRWTELRGITDVSLDSIEMYCRTIGGRWLRVCYCN